VIDCARCASPLEEGDLRCAVCALTIADEAIPAVDARARVLRCTVCGAAIEFDPRRQAPACVFCRSVMEIEQPHDPVEAARTYVPFAIDRAAATTTLRQWLAKRGWLAPATLHDEAVLESLTAVYWPAWVVSAKAQVTWTADSDHGARRSAWAPHAGELPLTFDRIIVTASRGLATHEAHALAPFYDLASAQPVEWSNVSVESFDAQRSAARAAIHAAVEQRARTAVEQHIPGQRYRNVHVACLVERLTTDRVALPAWVLAYRFRGKLYRAVVHGSRPAIVVGRAPIDWPKLVRIAAVVLAVAAIIAAIVLTR